MKELILLDKAKRQIAEAKNIDEIKDIRDKAEAVRMYYKKSGKSVEAMNAAAEIKLRCDRRAGELLSNMELEKGRPEKMSSDSTFIPNLSDMDITRNYSSQSQQIANIPEEQFENFIATKKDDGKEITTNEILRIAKINKHKNRINNILKKQQELPTNKYQVLYADPPWQYNDKCESGAVQSGGAEKYYPAMSINELCDLPILDLAGDNSVLFLWVTSPFLEDSFEIIKAWGFKYKASFVWDKVKHNMGHYNSVRHEFLLICTRGSCTPDNLKLFDSVQSIKKTKHSEKPEEFRNIIDTLYAGRRIELFARKNNAEGWEFWGNEL